MKTSKDDGKLKKKSVFREHNEYYEKENRILEDTELEWKREKDFRQRN